MRLKILENFSEIAILPCMNLITVKGGCDLHSPDNVHVVSEAGSASLLSFVTPYHGQLCLFQYRACLCITCSL